MPRRRPLDAYPRPGVTVDLAILTVTAAGTDDAALRVLVQERQEPDGRVLPGRFLRERHTVVDTVREVFEQKVGVSPSEVTPPRLLRLFDAPDRDDRTWAISVAHSVSMPEHELEGAKGDLVAVDKHGALVDGQPMLWDHEEIVSAAVASLRERYEFRYRYSDVPPDPDGFLMEPFTLHQLRRVHEAVVGEEMHKDNFARRMKPHLAPVTRGGEVVRSTAARGRPAVLYRRASHH
ncbi:NUDIX hydrolase [Janibacter cremeus]|uniref:NrtR DNA-binding winged helix domain-containing protein n=1 Tax=Janibacter cremeus TaxID=1285192 RepID=UPI0023F81498|nr:NUDIX hydrolase [Janibacter cremeus]WEV78810.1 NUDIX hydrolase [Janibacter cremeus]